MTRFPWGYYVNLCLALAMIWHGSTKPLDVALVWIGCALIVVIRAEGSRIREEARDGKS